MKHVAIFLLLCSAVSAQCKFTYSIVAKDVLNNATQGASPEMKKWLTEKMAKKYPDVCYREGAQPLVFFISVKPAVYHGTTTVTDRGTVEDSRTGNEIATVSTHQEVPEEVEYHKIFLSLEKSTDDGRFIVAHNFQGKTLQNTMYGFCAHNCHPQQKLFEEAIKWLHDGGLSDPKQSVLY